MTTTRSTLAPTPARPQLPNQYFRYGRAFIATSLPPATRRAGSRGHAKPFPREIPRSVPLSCHSRTDSTGQKPIFRSEVRVRTPTITHTHNPPNAKLSAMCPEHNCKVSASHLHKSVGVKRTVRTSICPMGEDVIAWTPIYDTRNGRSNAGSGCVRLVSETRC